MTRSCSRRRFLTQTAAIGLGTLAVPGIVRATAANDKLRLASIGVGGMGAADLGSLSSHPSVEVVALCDVDAQRLTEAAGNHSRARTFADYRRMLSEMADQIDAVNVATPDHTHAPAALLAMSLGKHVYCQKPLCHDVHEAREMRRMAEERRLVSQMGIQIHSASPYRTAVKLIQSGAIGKVSEAFSWSNKTWGYAGPAPRPAEPPAHLSWDLWLGTAPERPYSDGHYHPANWRKWVDFGCGTMGDMGIHILDPVFSALKLSNPLTIVSSSPAPPRDSHGMQNRVTYTFPGTRYTTESFRLTWSDGGLFPNTEDWPVESLPGQGSMFVGGKGFLLLPHVADPQLLPVEQFRDFKVERMPDEDHYHQWVNACLGNTKASAHFGYAGPLTEALLLGVIANRFPTQSLQWDATAGTITNFDPAAAMLRRNYRTGWDVL